MMFEDCPADRRRKCRDVVILVGFRVRRMLVAAQQRSFARAWRIGVGDVRESPALKILELLRELGAELSYHDPHVPSLPEFALASVPLEGAVSDADLALIVTAHPGVDHELIAQRARITVDLRGVTRGSSVQSVVRL